MAVEAIRTGHSGTSALSMSLLTGVQGVRIWLEKAWANGDRARATCARRYSCLKARISQSGSRCTVSEGALPGAVMLQRADPC